MYMVEKVYPARHNGLGSQKDINYSVQIILCSEIQMLLVLYEMIQDGWERRIFVEY